MGRFFEDELEQEMKLDEQKNPLTTTSNKVNEIFMEMKAYYDEYEAEWQKGSDLANLSMNLADLIEDATKFRNQILKTKYGWSDKEIAQGYQLLDTGEIL